MQLELYNAMFFIRSLKGPTDAFNIDDHGSTRSSIHLKLKHVLSRTNSARHFYFNRIPRLGNSLPTIYLDQSTGSIKLRVQWFLWDHLICTFKSDSPCTYHSCALALNAHVDLWCIILTKCFVFWPLVSTNGPSVHLSLSSPQYPSPSIFCAVKHQSNKIKSNQVCTQQQGRKEK